jgi:hypothetical protein
MIKIVQAVLTRKQQEAVASLFAGSLIKTQPTCENRPVDYVLFGSAEDMEIAIKRAQRRHEPR